MKLIKTLPKKMKIIGISALVSGIVFSNVAFATSTKIEARYSEKYKEWLELSEEEKENTLIPNTYTAEVPESLNEKFSVENNIPSMLGEIKNRKTRYSLENLSASYEDSSYNLNEDTKITVKTQAGTSACWAFSAISSLETNLSLTKQLNEVINFSPRHLEYATSKTFLDGVNENGYAREVGQGGIPNVAFNYLINGQGAVLESDMPFIDSEEKINLSEIDKNVNTIAKGYEVLPVINKKYDENGNIIYLDALGEKYSEKELKNARNIIKDHLVKYGAISAVTAGNLTEYYNNPNNIALATAYFCDDEKVVRDHAITIVGWDDNYSKTNFNPEHQPKNDGAYIVLNSYGTEVFDKGYLYVSYEDILIESILYGVTDATEKDYDTIYQNDFYGGLISIGAADQDTGYIASIYERNIEEPENLNSVGITATEYAEYEIFINPIGKDITEGSLVKVGTTKMLSPGYHRIDVEQTKLTGKEFAIVVKQKSEQGTGFYFPIEGNLPETVYQYVDAKEGSSLISLNGTEWLSLKDIAITGLDMTKSDTCLKAFTTAIKEDDNNGNTGDSNGDNNTDNGNEDNNNNENDNNNNGDNNTNEELKITSENYQIEEIYISKIAMQTTIAAFKKNITTNASDIEILDKENKVITDENELIKTGMKLKLNKEKEYTLVVRGDLNCDGNITLIDLSKLISHYNEFKEFILTGAPEKAGDLTGDGKITIGDVSQLLVIYLNL